MPLHKIGQFSWNVTGPLGHKLMKHRKFLSVAAMAFGLLTVYFMVQAWAALTALPALVVLLGGAFLLGAIPLQGKIFRAVPEKYSLWLGRLAISVAVGFFALSLAWPALVLLPSLVTAWMPIRKFSY